MAKGRRTPARRTLKTAPAAKPAENLAAAAQPAETQATAEAAKPDTTATAPNSSLEAAPDVAAATGSRPSQAPTPFDREYERPLSELPQLTFPNSDEYEFRVAAEQRRQRRMRNEAIFGAVLVFFGLAVLLAAHTPAFLVLAAIAAAAIVAYELTISILE